MKFRTSSSRKSHLATHAKESRRNEFKNANQINRCLEGLMPNQAKIDDSNLATENVRKFNLHHSTKSSSIFFLIEIDRK